MPNRVFDHVVREHRQLARDLLELQVAVEDGHASTVALDELRRSLSLHDWREERVLFPFLEAHRTNPDSLAALRREHRALERLQLDIAAAFTDGAQRRARLLLQDYALELLRHQAHEERLIAACALSLDEDTALTALLTAPP